MHYATEGVDALYWPMIASRLFGTFFLLVVVLGRRESLVVARDAWLVMLLNGILDVGGNFFYILALRTGRLDISAILSSLYPGATVLLAWILLKERLSRSQWVGIGAVLLAIVLFTI
jgi:uncharacterized membrane protein